MFSQGCHGQGKKSGNWKFFQVREKSGKFGLSQKLEKNWQKSGKSRDFQNFLKTEMAMAVLIFRNINLQNWPHSFVKWLFNSLKVSALLEDLIAEDDSKGELGGYRKCLENGEKSGKSQEILK